MLWEIIFTGKLKVQASPGKLKVTGKLNRFYGASPHSLPGRPLTNDSVNENWYCESGLHSGLALPEPIDHALTYHAGNAAASKKNTPLAQGFGQ